jgi:uncharacterized damage-inducible protein DinB
MGDMKMTIVALLAMAPLAATASGQTTVKDALVKHWKTSGDLTIAVAKAMPADSYNFRPNPEEMSFGQLMAHIAVANSGACAIASGMPRPTFPPEIADWTKNSKTEIDRETAIQFLTESFDFCNKAVASMTPERMDTVEGPPARNMTGFEWLWSYFTHTAHHRGQAEVYLRVKGITPPSYAF